MSKYMTTVLGSTGKQVLLSGCSRTAPSRTAQGPVSGEILISYLSSSQREGGRLISTISNSSQKRSGRNDGIHGRLSVCPSNPPIYIYPPHFLPRAARKKHEWRTGGMDVQGFRRPLSTVVVRLCQTIKSGPEKMLGAGSLSIINMILSVRHSSSTVVHFQ